MNSCGRVWMGTQHEVRNCVCPCLLGGCCACSAQLQPAPPCHRYSFNTAVVSHCPPCHLLQAEHDGKKHVASADMGGSIITGVDGNPLAVLAKQLCIPLYACNGHNVPFHMESKGGKQPRKEDDQEVPWSSCAVS